MEKYLDTVGLKYLWTKIKALVDAGGSGKTYTAGTNITITGTTNAINVDLPIKKGTGENTLIFNYDGNVSSGIYAIASGVGTTAAGSFSHTEGVSTVANNNSEIAIGQYNISTKTSATFGDAGNTLFSIGNGSSATDKSNAFEIRQNGVVLLKQISFPITGAPISTTSTTLCENLNADTLDGKHYSDITTLLNSDYLQWSKITAKTDDTTTNHLSIAATMTSLTDPKTVVIGLKDIASDSTLQALQTTEATHYTSLSGSITTLQNTMSNLVVQTTGTSTTTVMSQDAVTKKLTEVIDGQYTVVINADPQYKPAPASGSVTILSGYTASTTNKGHTLTPAYLTVSPGNGIILTGNSGYDLSSISLEAKIYTGTDTGKTSIAFNSNTNTITGAYSITSGDKNTVSSDYSTTFGYSNTNKGKYSLISGWLNNTSGEYSMAIGYSNTASQGGAVAIGRENVASGYDSLALGFKNQATAYSSVAFGNNTITTNQCEIAIGQCNVSSASSTDFGNAGNLSFSVGIGGNPNTDRKNGFEIRQNGETYVTLLTHVKDGTEVTRHYVTLSSVVQALIDNGTITL